MINLHTIEAMEVSDASLVAETLTGNRDAFGRIVARYQTLICSLTYSGIGNLSQSEDLAQETFITAWRQLAKLREPHKLRSWLCGIARNLTYDALKQQGREPSHATETLDALEESPGPELPPLDLTINREEAEILWRALERIPEIYREPLVLFYREQQSIEAVAASLELSEDNVKQRLSRGRKMLQEQVLAFVEGALSRSNPGKLFTLAVLSALPALTISAKAATLGAAAVKGSATAKAAGAMGLLGALLSPLAVIFGNYASYRLSLDDAHSDEERGHIKRIFLNSLLIALGICAILAAPLFRLCQTHGAPLLNLPLLFILAIVVYFLTLLTLVLRGLPGRRRHLAKLLQQEHAGVFPPAAYEYRSPASLFGWPLLHIRLGDRFDALRGPVKAWVAIGGMHSVGLVFASGSIAVAPLSFGGVAIGLVPFGAIALGLFPIGALCLGVWAYGALAVGWQVFCGCGVAWSAASGGMVFAHDFAVGGVALAAQANTPVAWFFMKRSLFYNCAQAVANHGFLLMLAWVIPMLLQGRVVRQARRREAEMNNH